MDPAVETDVTPTPIPVIPFWLHWWSIGWPVLMVIQLVCLVHIIRTGRPYWWIWIVMAFPMIGLAAYVLLEMRPTWRKVDFATLAWRLKRPAERIRVRQQQLDDSPTIRNRMTLADELHADGQYDRECEVLADGLRGAFRDDTNLMLHLTEAHLQADRTADAETWLTKCTAERTAEQESHYSLLKARILSRHDRFAEAEPLFQQLTTRRRNEAPRFYYAVALHQAGKGAESRAVLDDICKQYRRGTAVWRFQEKRWYAAAKQYRKKLQ